MSSLKEGGKAAAFEGAGLGLAKGGAKLAAKGVPGFKRFGRSFAKPDDRLVGVLDAENEMRNLAVELRDTLTTNGFSKEEAKRLSQSFFLPAEATHNQLVDSLSALPEGTLFSGGGKIRAVREMRDRYIDVAADSYVQGLKEFGDDDTIANMVVNRAKGSIKTARKDMGKLHDVVEDAIGTNTLVDTRIIKNSTTNDLQLLSELGKGAIDPQKIGTLMKRANGLPDQASFGAIKRWRSDLDSFMAGLSPEGRELARGKVTMLRGKATKAMEDALQTHDSRFGTSLVKDWKEANEATKAFKQNVDFKVLRKAIRAFENSDEIGAKVLARLTPDRGAKVFGRLKKVLGEGSDEWRALRTWKLNEVMKSAGLGTADGIRGSTMLQQLTTKGLGESAATELLGGPTVKRLQDFARAVEIVQNKPQVASRMGVHIAENNLMFGTAARVASTVVPMAAAASAGSAAFGPAGAAGGIATVVIPLQVISRLFVTNPKVADTFIKGTRTGFARRELFRALAQMGGMGVLDGVKAVVPPWASEEQIAEAQAQFPGIPVTTGKTIQQAQGETTQKRKFRRQ
jgi:hypothetical protein